MLFESIYNFIKSPNGSLFLFFFTIFYGFYHWYFISSLTESEKEKIRKQLARSGESDHYTKASRSIDFNKWYSEREKNSCSCNNDIF